MKDRKLKNVDRKSKLMESTVVKVEI